MQINADYVWIVPIVMSFVSGIVIWKSSQSQRISNPNMTNDYNKILKWVMGYCNLPWIFMGIGNVFQISTAEDYKQFKISNPAVLIFYLSILILFIILPEFEARELVNNFRNLTISNEKANTQKIRSSLQSQSCS